MRLRKVISLVRTLILILPGCYRGGQSRLVNHNQHQPTKGLQVLKGHPTSPWPHQAWVLSIVSLTQSVNRWSGRSEAMTPLPPPPVGVVGVAREQSVVDVSVCYSWQVWGGQKVRIRTCWRGNPVTWVWRDRHEFSLYLWVTERW